MTSTHPGTLVLWLAAAAASSAAGCAIEGKEACGPHQVYEARTTLLEFAVCVCDESEGWVYDQQRGHGCRQCPKGQSPVNGECAAMAPDAGSQPPDGSTPSEPTGVDEPCNSNVDCADYDAQYCTPTKVCKVDDCASGTNACSTGDVCCDYDVLLSGFSVCVAPDELDGTDCPMGGVKVEP